MSLFPVKVWIDSETYEQGTGSGGDFNRQTFTHLHEKLYYVEAMNETLAEERALELYMEEEAKEHIHAHTDGYVIVEHAKKK